MVKSATDELLLSEYMLGLRLLIRSIPHGEQRKGSRTYAFQALDEAMEKSEALRRLMAAIRRGRVA